MIWRLDPQADITGGKGFKAMFYKQKNYLQAGEGQTRKIQKKETIGKRPKLQINSRNKETHAGETKNGGEKKKGETQTKMHRNPQVRLIRVGQPIKGGHRKPNPVSEITP